MATLTSRIKEADTLLALPIEELASRSLRTHEENAHSRNSGSQTTD